MLLRGHGYCRKGSGKSLLEYKNQMEPELFCLLCKKWEEKCPLWIPVLLSLECGIHCSRGDLLPLLICCLMKQSGGNLLSSFIYGQVLFIPQNMNKETVFSLLLIVNTNCDMHVTQTVFFVSPSSNQPFIKCQLLSSSTQAMTAQK